VGDKPAKLQAKFMSGPNLKHWQKNLRSAFSHQPVSSMTDDKVFGAVRKESKLFIPFQQVRQTASVNTCSNTKLLHVAIELPVDVTDFDIVLLRPDLFA
jgi:hypothetical protein